VACEGRLMAALKYWDGTAWRILGDPLSAVTADVSFGGYKATLLGDPTAAQDAATKNYVDNTFRGYAFAMVSGEAAAAAGSPIRSAQQNNNIYANSEYFQGWEAGRATAIEVMKAGLVRAYAQIYITGGTANTLPEAGITLNGVNVAGTRVWTGTTTCSIIVQRIVTCSIGDAIGFVAVSGGSAYQGTDGRYSHGFLEWLRP
jgi:hypothetical protein